MKTVAGFRISGVRAVSCQLHYPLRTQRLKRGGVSPGRSCSCPFQKKGHYRHGPRLSAKHYGTNAATSAEQIANRRRWEESGNKEGNFGDWKWTLNWNEVMDNILDRIAQESEATAILSLQCDMCLEALKIDYPDLKDYGLESGILMTRVPIRDFDHGDQALMLPEAVRTLALLTALGHKVYVHCTAGINRATLTTLGYMTFVQGWDLYSALDHIKSKRPQANPYIDCWKNVKTRLLEGRSEEVIALSRKLFQKTEKDTNTDSFGNWFAAEDLVIKETFRRLLSCSISTISAMTDLKATALCSVCVNPDEIDSANKEIDDLHYELNIQRRRLAATAAAFEQEKIEHEEELEALKSRQVHQNANGDNSVGHKNLNSYPIDNPTSPPLIVYDELIRVKEEVNDLKQCIRKIAMASNEALSIDSVDPYRWEEEIENDASIIDLHETDETDDELE